MIKSWRDDWGQGEFPFYQVQLANFKEIKTEPGDSDWAELREAQALAKQAIPAVDAACITDRGVAKDIHPKDKQNVAKRLARLALVDVYGMKNIVRSGPVYKSASFQDGKALIDFDNGGRKLIPYYNEPLSGSPSPGLTRSGSGATPRLSTKTPSRSVIRTSRSRSQCGTTGPTIRRGISTARSTCPPIHSGPMTGTA